MQLKRFYMVFVGNVNKKFDLKKRVNMKRILASFFAALFLAGCSTVQSGTNLNTSVQTGQEKTLKVVTTQFSAYDWARRIVGNIPSVEIQYLPETGVDLHNYQPSVQDLVAIKNSDLFIYVGGVSEQWVRKALNEEEQKKGLNFIEVLGDDVKTVEVVEGMQVAEHNHSHGDADDHKHDKDDDHDADDHKHDKDNDHDADDHKHDKDDDHDADDHKHDKDTDHDADKHKAGDAKKKTYNEFEVDEHVWLSLNNAMKLSKAIADRLSALDPEHKADYQKNLTTYQAELEELLKEYQTAVKEGNKKPLLFADRFAFRYLVDEIGLKYYAAFDGCAAEVQADFETVVFLSDRVKEFELNSVLKIEGSQDRLANRIIEASGKDSGVLELDSMQSVTKKELATKTYLDTMRQNLEVLKKVMA